MRVVAKSVQIESLTNKTIKISGDIPLFKQMQGKIVKNKWEKTFKLEFSFSSEVNIEGATVKLEEDTSVIKIKKERGMKMRVTEEEENK
ncbi:hypothetical protein C2G38_2174644 [Gigaspora rosea]|uniref:SHSP domain-containing protein n=1 Tax=Gigaspora rosea TaxID=44941 RepID=A0A397U5N6_9GLOM|nr:hypothetical protein C2G38_2219239 [Gigaspora rosea]RIB22143.1 hypothetical protein C2G38_2174644 [Gigaspora rosea]